VKIGKVGFCLALAPWVVYGVTILCIVLGAPGFG